MPIEMQYDYIIIGAGSAGCLLANRLSAEPSRKVLLLEAGKRDRHPNIHVPLSFSKLFRTAYDWGDDTAPQQQMGSRPMFQPRGKVLGGSSSINAMIYIRGHRLDYDGWAEAGNPGWSYEEVLPYFRRFERNLLKKDDYHGNDGELVVSDLREKHPLSETLLKAAAQAGLPLNEDFNGAQQEGFGFYQVTQDRGRRCSAATAFLHPLRKRTNLQVLTEATVHRLKMKGRTVTGVVYERHGQTHEARAGAEVILSAGAFNSPQILLLSGIGPKKELQKHGLQVHHHLSGVGKNLQDHLLGGITQYCTRNFTFDTVERWPHILGHLWRYLTRRRGPLTSNVAECGGFLRTRPELEAPDLQFHFGPAFYLRHGYDNPQGVAGYSLGPTLICPESQGEITLASKDPRERPRIDPRYFTAERDLQTMIEGYRITRRLLDQPAFKPFRKGDHLPERELQTDDEIADYMRRRCETLYHPVGTCKMGKDGQAVVDHRLRVHGLQGLRVIDASVMPTITRGNTNAPTMMIAEKGAEMVLQDRAAHSAMEALPQKEKE